MDKRKEQFDRLSLKYTKHTQLLCTVSKGYMLGEEDVAGQMERYTTTVKCIQSGELMVISKDDFLKLKNQHVWSSLLK